MKRINLLALIVLALVFTACETPKLGYFQDLQHGEVKNLTNENLIKVQSGDKLSILVSSKNPELAYLYNLPVVGHYQSSTSGRSLQTSTVAHYTVDEKGDIEFPYLGSLHIAGLTRSQVSTLVRTKLIENNMLADPSCTVDFLDMYFSVMGEVAHPGRFVIDHDKVTLLDALSQAGDLTIYGRRDNVLVLRSVDGVQRTYRVNLSDGQTLYQSPVYYLQQNDIVYIEPNERRAREASNLGNQLVSPGLWVSIASLLTSVAVLIWK